MTSQEFAAILEGLRRFEDAGFAGGAALATLVRTRGPVLRRPGTRMLIFGDGTLVRGLSGGCPEADIAQRAHEVIASGESRILRYDREHGYDALLELGCGGELEVLVEPLRSPRDLQFAKAVEACLHARRDGTLFIVFARDGQCLPQPRRLLWSDGIAHDELADARLTDTLLSLAPPQADAAATRLECVATRAGTVHVLVERLEAPLRLVLVGGGAVVAAMARMARILGWPALIVDHRSDTSHAAISPNVPHTVAEPRHLRERAALDARTAVVVMTHNLERDIAYLQALRSQPLAYLGALGSRARAARMRNALGTTVTPLQSPAGLDIGSETPEEIALAVLAEIQAAVSGHAGGRLSATDGPIH